MFKRQLIIIFLAIIVLIFLGFNFISRQYMVPVLMYHSVNLDSPDGNRLVVSVDNFERQMRFFKKHDYQVVPLETIAALLKEHKRIPYKTVAITFDDGYKDNYTYAYPILKKYNLCATIFVIVNTVGSPGGDRLNWEEIKMMRDSGLIYFGSHALDHKALTDLGSKTEIKRQISESKKILEEKLSARIDSFSYPLGRFNPEVKQFVKDAGYKLAVIINPNKRIPRDDVFAIKRIRISSNAANPFVFWVQTCGYYNLLRENFNVKIYGEK